MDLGKPVLSLDTGKGSISLYAPKTGVLVAKAAGFMTADLWLPQVKFYEKVFLEAPTVHIFRDAEEVRTLESGYREQSQKFVSDNRQRYAQIVFLTNSALLRMAINSVRIFTRAPLRAVNRDEFEVDLAKVLRPPAAQSG